MNRLKLPIIFLAIMLICTMAAQAAEVVTPPNTLTVHGNSSMDVTPDQAFISISVVNTAQTASDAGQENARLSAAVQEKLLSMKIDKTKIRTTQYNISPIYSNENDTLGKTQVLTGYKITNTLQVTLDDIATVGSVIDGALAAGANQISSVHFTKKNELGLKQAVLQDAIKDAAAKAAAMAETLGMRLEKPVAVSEEGTSIQAPDTSYYLLKATSARSTSVSPGMLQVTGSVTIVYEIK